MTTELLRRVAFLHGIVAWIGALSLVLVAFLVFRAKLRPATLHTSAILATLLRPAAGHVGWRVPVRNARPEPL